MIDYRDVSTLTSDHKQIKNSIVSENDKNRLAKCARLVPEGVRTLLDVGTKTGYFCRIVRELGIDAQGIDDTIRENLEPGIRVSKGDIRDLPFENNSFDCVTAFEVLEHLTYPDCLLAAKELRRIARHHVLVSVPYKEFPIRQVNHLQNFDERKLERVLGTPLRFHSYQEYPIEPAPFAFRIINKCFRMAGIHGKRIAYVRPRWLVAHLETSN